MENKPQASSLEIRYYCIIIIQLYNLRAVCGHIMYAHLCVNKQLGKMRLMIPCRALTCSHLQCFDATLYIQMNEKKPTWVCPVCDKKAPYEHLIIDGSVLLTPFIPVIMGHLKSTNTSVIGFSFEVPVISSCVWLFTFRIFFFFIVKHYKHLYFFNAISIHNQFSASVLENKLFSLRKKNLVLVYAGKLGKSCRKLYFF